MKGAKAKFASSLMNAEAKLERTGGPKTSKEAGLERAISKVAGKPYKGKR